MNRITRYECNPEVIILRGGAPEKIGLSSHLYNITLIDHCNLMDLSVDKVIDWTDSGKYILPSDEGDYSHYSLNRNSAQDHILLCRTKDRFLHDYEVKKSSKLYINWDSDKAGIILPKTTVLDDNHELQFDKVYKTDDESGSRGVLIPRTHEELESWLQNKSSHTIIAQDKVPSNLNYYYSMDIQLKNGNLLGYSFILNPSGEYPRWFNGYIVNNDEIEYRVTKLVSYLQSAIGLYSGFINIDGVTNPEFSEFWMYEINWRYSGIGNILRCLGIDIIYNYLYNIPYEYPKGMFPYTMECIPILRNDITKKYIDGDPA